jgi:DNA repair protein RadD
VDLYPHQRDFVTGIDAAFEQHQAVMGQAATGFGKSVAGSHLARRWESRGELVYFAVHRRNLIRQTSKTFAADGIHHGTIAAGRPYDRHAMVHIASIDTLHRRLDALPVPVWLVIDEAHMAAARTWASVVNRCRERGAKVLGLSATPSRYDGKALSALFDAIVHGPSVRWLIDHGFLSDYIAWSHPQSPDLGAVHTLAGDYKRDELEDAVDRPTLIGSAVESYRKHADGTRAVAYCVSRKHSRNVCEAFNTAGIPAVHIDGETPDDEQREAIEGFASGKYKVLSNVELVTTGFDLSAQVGRDVPIETVILLRPTQSVALHLQMIGRGLRRKPRPAVILDHAGNLRRLGLPDDDRDWSLEGRARRKRTQVADLPIRQCEQCYHVHRPAPVCPQCGFVYPVQAREIQQVDGDLERIERAQRVPIVTIEESPRTMQQLIAQGKARGMRNPFAWARWQMQRAVS